MAWFNCVREARTSKKKGKEKQKGENKRKEEKRTKTMASLERGSQWG